MNDIYTITEEIKSLGFKRGIYPSLYKYRRNSEYWVKVNEDESIRFESFERHSTGLNYDLEFKNIHHFTKFAKELLKFAKKEVYQ